MKISPMFNFYGSLIPSRITISTCYIAGLLLVSSCKNDPNAAIQEEQLSNFDKSAPQVQIVALEQQVFDKQLISNGKIESRQKSELRFEINGQIATINVRNGQRVIKGQLLAQLDNAIQINAVDKAQIQLDKAKAQFEEDKINYGASMSGLDNIPDEVLKNLKLRSGMQEAANALNEAKLQLRQTYVRAPFSGLVANLETRAGDYITSADAFCTLVEQQNLDVVFAVLEAEFNFVSIGQAINVVPFSDDQATYTGLITSVNPLVDGNGLITIRAAIKDAGNRLYDGMNAKVFINQPLDNVFVVPKEALVLRSNREVVFVYENGSAKWNYVDVIAENNSHYALKPGSLKVGDSIIVSGNLNLAHDARVEGVFNSN
ncbi:efflux RND transporter periplasmic adaptor subunit [Gilvibacter sp. SZ-19]|uniref:efflux RND transporter periplasmic adaptor subunit n=1 Tax=Gilvibacter sp. SZ-19 TaxID=754429 RepID=UPI0012F977A0|nr:efflux RND transporter periplasmic adaptor subunit [Gilvibacter sp. SZ-19]